MGILTNFLNLFKYDPSTDGESTFNIDTALNENWEKIDTATKEINDSLNEHENTSDIHLNSEAIQDIIGNLLQSGSNVSIEYDDANNQITIASNFTNTQRSDEDVRDVIGAAVRSGSGINVTVSDTGNTITFSLSVNGTDNDINTSGGEVIDVINVTKGIVTSMSKRTLTPANIGALSTSGTAADSDKLGNKLPSSFREKLEIIDEVTLTSPITDYEISFDPSVYKKIIIIGEELSVVSGYRVSLNMYANDTDDGNDFSHSYITSSDVEVQADSSNPFVVIGDSLSDDVGDPFNFVVELFTNLGLGTYSSGGGAYTYSYFGQFRRKALSPIIHKLKFTAAFEQFTIGSKFKVLGVKEYDEI